MRLPYVSDGKPVPREDSWNKEVLGGAAGAGVYTIEAPLPSAGRLILPGTCTYISDRMRVVSLTYTAADAATLHIYSGWDANNNDTTASNIASHLAVAATRSFSNGDNFKATIPQRLRIWITEMGLYPPGALDGTWLHAMFYLAMDLQLPAALPTLDVVIPYCFMCGDPTAPSFTTEEYGSVVPPQAAGTVSIRTMTLLLIVFGLFIGVLRADLFWGVE